MQAEVLLQLPLVRQRMWSSPSTSYPLSQCTGTVLLNVVVYPEKCACPFSRGYILPQSAQKCNIVLLIHAVLMALFIILIQSVSFILFETLYYVKLNTRNLPLLDPVISLINLLVSNHDNVIVEKYYSVSTVFTLFILKP